MKSVQFRATKLFDTVILADWIEQDIFHFGKMKAGWWLPTTGNLLACCVEDEKGPVMYLRVDADMDKVRLNIQFAPEEQVSKRRVVRAVLDGFPRLVEVAKSYKVKGMIFESVNEPLIQFMKSQGFEHCNGDDYLLQFQENI